jgi:hypothetical protein
MGGRIARTNSSDKRSAISDDVRKQASAREYTRRRFLGVSAGVGLFVLGVGGLALSGNAEDAPLAGWPHDLEIFRQGYPRALFFRMPEVEARRGVLSYEEWEKRFLPLNGIVGKVLDESSEHEGKYDNLPYFLRYKENNPGKLVLLHYHGAGRRATDTTAGFFAGHWLYYAGTNLVREVDADPHSTILHVAATSVFTLDRAQGVSDDVVIAPIGADGKPDWKSAEQVRLEEIDAENETITVERGAYETESRSFPAGSYLAAHVLTAPYPAEGNPVRNVTLWSYNFSTVGPRDAEGRNGADALVDHLVEKLGPDGPLASLDGLVFDVLSFGVRNAQPKVDVDADADGVADGGTIDGVDVMGLGTLEFVESLRERLPEKIVLADGQKPDKSQRSFGHLNGMESEGFPDIEDFELDHLSRGMNVLSFWKENSTAPSVNYVSFKYTDTESEKARRNTFEEPDLSEDQSYRKLRLALASAQFVDAAFTYPKDWAPPETLWEQEKVMVRVFDELWQGVEQNPNWLGMPLGPAIHLAAESPDLLDGQGETWPRDFVERFEGEEVAFTQDSSAGGMVVEPTDSDADTPVLEKTVECTLPDIDVPEVDLFVSLRLRADPLEEYPASIGRRVYVSAVPNEDADRAVEEFTWANEKAFTATFYFKDVGPGPVDLSFEVEGDRPVFFERLSAHSATDAMYREFENGVVFANPSTRPYTFDLRDLFPNASFRRLEGSEIQDPQTNDGQLLGEELSLDPKDGLFVERIDE